MCARPILVEAPTQGLPLYGVDAKRPLHPPGALPDSAPSGRSSGVEHNLAKVGVEGSNPFARSIFDMPGIFGKMERIGRRQQTYFFWFLSAVTSAGPSFRMS